MCGFVGMLIEKDHEKWSEEQLQAMTEQIIHRGPDDEGYYVDEDVRLGFRRLSIIDLEQGKQPLSYKDEAYWIIFNGEIYNYIELRKELAEEGYQFQTASDTEVLVALYDKYQEAAFAKLRGMFACLIWDKQRKRLVGARDPFGIKPFFYWEKEEGLFCASEKKSLLVFEQEHQLEQEALQHYLTFQYVPEPLTMTAEIKKLEPGHYFIKEPGKKMQIERYWQVSFQPVASSVEQLKQKIKDVLIDSVQMHMRSDVPVGAFLSGGIDSTTIVSLAKELNPNLLTFTVGFEEHGYSEIAHVQKTAEELQVKNHYYPVSMQEFVDELPKIMWHMDDPLADPAAVPLYFVAREASKQVKVVLSGEGADELFGGYNIYREPESLKMFSSIPQGLKGVLKSLSQLLPEGMKGKSFIERGCTPLEERYIGNAKMYTEEEKRKLLLQYQAGFDYTKITQSLYQEASTYDDVHKMQYIDMHTWLRGDILVKADKMTMAHSIELRVPFLDKEVFSVASGIDVALKIANQTTKYTLREAMRGIVPEHILYQKKLGFPVPIRVWLKDSLYDWAVKLIADSQTDHLFHKHYLLKLLEEHRQGKLDHSRKLWTVLAFMIWHQVYVEKVYDFTKEDKTPQYT